MNKHSELLPSLHSLIVNLAEQPCTTGNLYIPSLDNDHPEYQSPKQFQELIVGYTRHLYPECRLQDVKRYNKAQYPAVQIMESVLQIVPERASLRDIPDFIAYDVTCRRGAMHQWKRAG